MATLSVAVTLAIPAVLVFLFLPFSALNKVLTSEATSAKQRKLAMGVIPCQVPCRGTKSAFRGYHGRLLPELKNSARGNI